MGLKQQFVTICWAKPHCHGSPFIGQFSTYSNSFK